MDVNSVSGLISTLGFPIVVCGALFWYMVKEQRELRKTIDNNTDVMLRILEHIKVDEEVHNGIRTQSVHYE